MPTYVYACTNPDCGHQFEAVQAFTDDALTVCPVCGQRLRKVFGSVGVVFKGSGFYRNDSREKTGGSGKSGSNGEAKAGAKSEANGSGGKSEGSSSSSAKSEGSKSEGSKSSSAKSDGSNSSGSSSNSGGSGSNGSKSEGSTSSSSASSSSKS